ncbi:MAG: glycosyltransferase family 4 protein [Pseudomonadota bacterium]
MAQKKLSIAQIHWGFPPTIGGVETHLALLLPTMVKRGHKVSLLTNTNEGCPEYSKFKGVEVYRNILMDLNWLQKRGIGGIEKEVKKLIHGYIDDTKPDVLHAHNMHYFIKTHARILEDISIKKGIPLVLTAHNVWDDVLYLELTRDIKWDHIIAVSNYIRREIIGIGWPAEKITTLHHGIDTKKFKPGLDLTHVYKKYPKLKRKRVIFHPARLGLGKGCDLSIKALWIIKKEFPNTVLMMAGSKNIIDWGNTQASDIAYFVDLVNHFGLHKDVIIDSYALDEMPALYNACDVAVYPSTAQEPFGMTMLEAMACKKPMIVTNTGGMPEIIQNNVNGFVVPVKDFNALADRIMTLFSHPDMIDKFGETGFKMVQEKYTENHITDNTLEIYKKLL